MSGKTSATASLFANRQMQKCKVFLIFLHSRAGILEKDAFLWCKSYLINV